MYTTCIFCTRELGRNQILESFPVGRRLAFDPALGRLWVICPRCDRWNLTPLEERWEAIEHAESLCRSTPRRIATEHIGLTRLREGTELVRIGRPLRPEYAAWRYGDQFGRRRRRRVAGASLGMGAVGALALVPPTIGLPITGLGVALGIAGSKLVLRSEETVARLRTESHGMIAVCRRHLRETRLFQGSDGAIALDLPFRGGGMRLEGRDAIRVLSRLMPRVNDAGGPPALIENAVRTIDAAGGPDGYLQRLSRYAEGYTYTARGWWAKRKGGLHGVPGFERLALEMAVHEEAEARALRGELAELERAWREAEEIASIADDLLTPGSVIGKVNRFRRT